jgi:hypothetical protein
MIPTCVNVYNGHFIFESIFSSMLIQLQRLALLSAAAEGCASVRASDLPDSASDPVMRLRVMGNFSVSSEDGDDEDGFINEAWAVSLRTDTSVNISGQGPILSSKVAKRPRNPSNGDSSEQIVLFDPNSLS